MARSSLFAELQRLYRNALLADVEGPDAAPGRRSGTERRGWRNGATGRREFLILAGSVAAASAGIATAETYAREAPRIAVIGAGIAGLTAGWTLRNAGYSATIYEASRRVGGRMHSDTETWANGQVSEHCGELIDSHHTMIIGLAHRYKIKLIDRTARQPKAATETDFFFGRFYRRAQAERDFQPVYHALTRDQKAAGDTTTFDHHSQAGEALDNTSAYDWIERNVPDGHRSPMGRLIDVAYDVEFGAPTREQSALNIVTMLAGQSDPRHFTIFGNSNERYHLLGGNERLPRAIGVELERRKPGTIRLGTSLTSIAKREDGGYLLRLQSPDSPVEVIADYVIMAIPFSVLRRLDYTQAGFDARKRAAIEQLGYGTNVKLHLQFDARLWNRNGPWGVSTGESFTDLGYQNTWEVTLGQHGASGILVDYMGSAGAGIAGNPQNPAAVRDHARRFLGQLETVFPGVSKLWNGRATLDVPALSPFARGSYSYWKVGQYTGIAGIERLPSGQCHFAGEHCSIDFQGYMEGGAREGVRAAHEVVQAIQRRG